MYRYFLTFLVLISLLISNRRDWSSTPIDRYFNSNFNQMLFRSPIYLIPYDLKIGFLNYGGPGYFKAALNGNYDLVSNPIILDNEDINDNFLSSSSYRNAVFIELDIMKYNLLEKLFHQNLFDFHIGAGFRFTKMLSNLEAPIYGDFSNKDYRFKPSIYDGFINNSFVIQFSPKFFFYTHYSFGLSYASIYESLAQKSYINASGLNENFSFGYKYIFKQKSLPYNYTIGLELKLGRTYLNKINDKDDVSPIIGLDINSIALILTFGTLFGGEDTNGDIAYKLMLDKDYIGASNKYKQFLNIYTHKFRYDKAKKMLNFCYTQIPYQYFDMAIQFFNKNDYDKALINFNKSEQIANPELILEIEFYKRKIALHMLNDIKSNLTQNSFYKSMQILTEIRKISPYLWSETDRIEAKILIEKGDILNNKNNYLYAIDFYQQALDLDPSLFKEINQKYSNVVISIINDVNNTQNFEELKLVREYLNIIIELKPQYYDSYFPFINDIDKKLNIYNQTINKMSLKDYVKNRKIKDRDVLLDKNIKLGMTIHEIEALLGNPNSITEKDGYELWWYKTNYIDQTYFFKNYILMKIN